MGMTEEDRDEAIKICDDWETFFRYARSSFPRKEMYCVATAFLAEVEALEALSKTFNMLKELDRQHCNRLQDFGSELAAMKEHLLAVESDYRDLDEKCFYINKDLIVAKESAEKWEQVATDVSDSFWKKTDELTAARGKIAELESEITKLFEISEQFKNNILESCEKYRSS